MADMRLPQYVSNRQLATNTVARTQTPGVAGLPGQAQAVGMQALFVRSQEIQTEEAMVDAQDAMVAFNEANRNYLNQQIQRTGTTARGVHGEGSEFYEKSYAEITAGMSDKAKTFFRQRFDPTREASLNQLAAHEAREHQATKLNSLEVSASNLRKQILAGTTPEVLERELAAHFESMRTMWPGVDHSAAYQKFAEGNITEFLTQAAVNDPSNIDKLLERYEEVIPGETLLKIKALADKQMETENKGDIYNVLISKNGDNHFQSIADLANPKNWDEMGINFKTSRQLIEAFKANIVNTEYARDLQEERRNEMWEANDQQTWLDFFNGNLTNEELFRRAAADEIPRTTVTGIMGWKRSGAASATDNWLVAGDLWDRMARGEDIRADALKAASQGQIKGVTYISMIKKQGDQEYKRGLQAIKSALKPSEFERWNPDKNYRFKEAVEMFNGALAADTEKQFTPMEIANQVLNRYSTDLRRTFAGMPAPKYLPEGKSKMDRMALDEAAMQTTREHAAGRLSDEEFLFEMQLLQDSMNMLIEFEKFLAEQEKNK